MITFYIKHEKMSGSVLPMCIAMVIMCDPPNPQGEQVWSLILTATMFLFHLYILQSVLLGILDQTFHFCRSLMSILDWSAVLCGCVRAYFSYVFQEETCICNS